MRAFPRNKLAASVAMLCSAIAPIQAVHAQDQSQDLMLEEIVVTAQKREQGLQDVPIAVTAVSGEKINDMGITDLTQLTQYIPNVDINQGAQNPNLYIRGIGSGTNAGFEQSVGMYIDGVYSGRGVLASVPFTMDLARIEVLKGPQGILFGKNTIGGAVSVTTQKPTDEFEGYVDAQYSPGDGEQLYTLALSGPIANTLSGRVAVRYEGMDGWWDNKLTGDTGPDLDNWFARGALRWEPTVRLEILAKYEYGNFSNNARPTVNYQSDQPLNIFGEQVIPIVDDRDEAAFDLTSNDNVRTDVFALTLNWDADFATLTSISAYSAYDLEAERNTDQTANPGLHRDETEKYSQLSQELRLVSPGGQVIDWIVGGYYQKTELEVSKTNVELDFAQSGPLSVPGALVNTEVPIPTVFDQDGDAWAIFAHGTWNMTDRWRTSLGLRYDRETKKLDKVVDNYRIGIRANADLTIFARPSDSALVEDLRSHSFLDEERTEDKFTWGADVQWDATDNSMLYAKISTGFKGGGYDEAYSGAGPVIRTADIFTGTPDGGALPGNDISVLEYEPETVTAYELGAKMTLADGRAELNVAVFRMDYKDLQTSSLIGDAFRVGNAGESFSQGVELDGRWRATQKLAFRGAVAYLDAKYSDFTGATCTVTQATDPENNPGCLRDDGSNIAAGDQGGQDLGGETLLFAPEWSASLSGEYIQPLGNALELMFNLDVNYKDEFYSALDLDPSTVHDSSAIWNTRLALGSRDGIWVVALIGKNLTDEVTHVWKNDVPLTNSNSYFAVPERPRSFALQGSYRF